MPSKKPSQTKILFLTATRADFGKIKSLIRAVASDQDKFKPIVAITGMHLSELHGSTYREVEKEFPTLEIHKFANSNGNEGMEITLANTIHGFSKVVDDSAPDFIVIHGDRVEALAGAITGALKNTIVGHIEGGEVSGTIDELMRHATSKMSHIHFVANNGAKELLVQMGEQPESIKVIGSPDLDLMKPEMILPISEAKSRYEIPFDKYRIVLFHPVTTNLEETEKDIRSLCEFIRKESTSNFIVCGPNNDQGSRIVWENLNGLRESPNVKFFPSIRFEHFISLLSFADYIIGNSSAGIREAPYLGTPCINLGTRQNQRAQSPLIIDLAEPSYQSLKSASERAMALPRVPEITFGDGRSNERFMDFLNSLNVSEISVQKTFRNLKGDTK